MDNPQQTPLEKLISEKSCFMLSSIWISLIIKSKFSPIYEIFVKYGIWRRWRLSKHELYLQDEHCIQR